MHTADSKQNIGASIEWKKTFLFYVPAGLVVWQFTAGQTGAFTNGKGVNIIPVLVDIQLEPLDGVWCSGSHFLYAACGQRAQDEDATHCTSGCSKRKN
jgi:hypothetical protein